MTQTIARRGVAVCLLRSNTLRVKNCVAGIGAGALAMIPVAVPACKVTTAAVGGLSTMCKLQLLILLLLLLLLLPLLPLLLLFLLLLPIAVTTVRSAAAAAAAAAVVVHLVVSCTAAAAMSPLCQLGRKATEAGRGFVLAAC